MAEWCAVPRRQVVRLGPMRWFLAGSVGILAFDAVVAFASTRLGFEYGAWWPGALGAAAIYGVPAFMAARERASVVAGALVGTGIALVDVLVGWPLAGAIIPEYFPDGTPAEVASSVVFALVGVGALGAVIGLIAGILGARRPKASVGAGG